jgi:Inosine-uridine preferring nucleoside hydrolase
LGLIGAAAALAAAVVLGACAPAAAPPAERGAIAGGAPERDGACVLVDSDAGLDDVRAVAALAPHRRLAAIVVTEGLASNTAGAGAMRHLMAGLARPVPVIVGEAAPAGRGYTTQDWLPAVRAASDRLNGFLAAAVPAAPRTAPLADEVEAATRGCARITLLAIGPWTSFLRYGERIQGRLERVVAQGRPYLDEPGGRPLGFNCVFDEPSCRAALDRLHALGTVWVDIPQGPPFQYTPTAGMMDALAGAGLPGLVAAVMRARPQGWQGTSLWDDLAALYLLRPDAFRRVGAHHEPAVPPEEIRRLWALAVGAKQR